MTIERQGVARTQGSATPLLPLFCLLGVVLLLSSVTLAIKYVFQHSAMNALSLALIRVTIGFVFLCAITVTCDWRGFRLLNLRDVALLTLVGVLGVLSYAVSAYGLMHTSVTNYALIYSLLPACTALISVLLGKEAFSFIKISGITLSLVGCIVAVTGQRPGVELNIRPGDGYVLTFTIMMSAHIVLSAEIVKRFGVMVSNTVMFGTSALLLAGGTWTWPLVPADAYTATIVPAVIYVGIATAGVFLLRYRALQTLPPATVGTFHNLIPIVTILLAYVFFDEAIGGQTFIGAAGVVLGAELVRRAYIPPWVTLRLPQVWPRFGADKSSR